MLARLLLSCAIICCSPTIASACVNGVLLEVDAVARHIKQAERLAAAGKYPKAMRRHAGDLEDAKAAFSSCRKMTKHKTICKPRDTKHLIDPWE